MMRAATLLWALLATVAGTGLFLLKYQVQAEERHLRDLRKDMAFTQQSIHLLKAEWSYLNDPVRLGDQAERHLAMRPMRVSQIVALDSIPLRGAAPFQPPGLVGGASMVRPSHDGARVPPVAKGKKPLAAPKHSAGRTMTALHVKAKRSQEVASARVRP